MSLFLPTRIFIADDHAFVRGAIRMLLQTQGGFEVVGECARGADVESMVRDLAPDIVILDVGLADMSGIDVAEALKRRFPGMGVVILTGSAKPSVMRQALSAGADAYVVKQDDGDNLLHALRCLSAGERYISPSAAKAESEAEEDVDDQKLTKRERQIIRFVSRGMANSEIADNLHISVLTVRKHRQNLMLKLNLKNSAEITNFAHKSGLADGVEAD